MEKYALVSKATYDNDLNLDGYIVDTDLSNRRTLVAVNENDKHVIVGYRGTNIKNHGDNLYNTLIGIGAEKQTKEYKRNKRATQRTINKYEGYNIETTGHSRGALDAYNIGQDLKLHSHVFNPPSRIETSLITAIGNFLVNRKNDNSNIYFVKGDPVGWLGRGLAGRKHYVKQKHRDPHTIHNFL